MLLIILRRNIFQKQRWSNLFKVSEISSNVATAFLYFQFRFSKFYRSMIFIRVRCPIIQFLIFQFRRLYFHKFLCPPVVFFNIHTSPFLILSLTVILVQITSTSNMSSLVILFFLITFTIITPAHLITFSIFTHCKCAAHERGFHSFRVS